MAVGVGRQGVEEGLRSGPSGMYSIVGCCGGRLIEARTSFVNMRPELDLVYIASDRSNALDMQILCYILTGDAGKGITCNVDQSAIRRVQNVLLKEIGIQERDGETPYPPSDYLSLHPS